VKLCRFELLTAPGVVRTGIVHGGTVYETDGQNPIGMHQAADVRPLPPVGQPPSIRFFRFDESPLDLDEAPYYSYGNPSSIIGASQIVPMPEFTGNLDYEPNLAVVIGDSGESVAVEEADRFVLGFSLMLVLVARDAERGEIRVGSGPGRSRDIAMALGPVLTTPEELEDVITDESAGRRYKLSAVSRINGVEQRRGDAENLRFTVAQCIAAASQSTPLRAGDIIAIGPLVSSQENTIPLSEGDEIQISVEKLGTLSLKIE
jgi:fumarylacetoacetate (FAA) hydrolase